MFEYQAILNSNSRATNSSTVKGVFKVIVTDDINNVDSVGISANSPTFVRLGKDYDPIIDSNALAVSKKEGDITSKVQVIYNNVDISRVGKYNVMFKVVSSSGITAYEYIDVLVQEDEHSSMISSSDKDIFIVNAPLNNNDLFSMLDVYASDFDGTDITKNAYISSFGGYEYDNVKAGRYQIEFSVKDMDDNIITSKSYLNVKEQPVIADTGAISYILFIIIALYGAVVIKDKIIKG
jgi:hypothetical protein